MVTKDRLEAIRELKRIRKEKKRVKFIGYMRKKGVRARYVRCE